MTTLLPLQQSAPLVDLKTGCFTVYFQRWAAGVLARIGGLTGGQYGTLAVSSGTIFWDLNANPNAELTLVNGASTMSPPINLVAGLVYKLTILQPATGAPGTITWGDPPFRFPGGVTPTLSTANGAIDLLWFFCDGTNIFLCVEALNQS